MSTPAWIISQQAAQITADRTEELAGTLASFRHYPPEANLRSGFCYGCGTEVPAGQGVVVLGCENGGVFATPLDSACLATIAKAKRDR
jgi:hypothetical protein